MGKVRSPQDYYKQHIGSVIGNLRRRGDNYLAGVIAEQLVEYYFITYKLPTIGLLNEGKARPTSEGPSSKRQDANSVAVTVRFDVECKDKIDTVLDFEISDTQKFGIIKHDKQGFFIKTDFSLANAKELLETYEKLVLEFVNQRNTEIEQGNNQFRDQIIKIITECKSKLKTQSDMLGQLKQIIPLSIKANPSSPVVPLSKKKQIVINPPQPRATAQPEIDQKILEAVIDILFRGGRTFETAPETFVKLGEEDLRNILISFLNGNFELRAVGEAFNKLGKSDISLVYSGNNLFIAECKYWGGEELYGKTIDQLFRYLTWRESVGVLITFVDQKDFSLIINKAIDATTSHSTVIANSIVKKSDSYFITKHLFPDDKEKTVEIHHLLFTLFSPRSKVTQ